jgi:integrase
MTKQVSHLGGANREPVYSGGHRVKGLWQRKLSDGSTVYEGRLRIDGTDKRVVLMARTLTDAKIEIESLRTDRARDELHRQQSLAPTLTELAADWHLHLQSRVGLTDRRRRYSQRTVDLYDGRLRDHILPTLGRKLVTDIGVADVRRLVDRLSARLAPGTVTSCINILSGLLRFGVRQGVLDHNICRSLDRDDRPGAGRKTEPRYLTEKEISALLAKVGTTFRPVLTLCAFGGLRISEALGLRWRDLDLKAGTITVAGQLGADGRHAPTKTASSEAVVTMLPVVRRELLAHRTRVAGRSLARVRPEAFVFTTTRGLPQNRHNAARALRKGADAAGLNPEGIPPVGVHDLRHSLAAAAMERNASPVEVAQLLRHANPRVTMTVYAGLTRDAYNGAATKLAGSGFGA